MKKKIFHHFITPSSLEKNALVRERGLIGKLFENFVKSDFFTGQAISKALYSGNIIIGSIKFFTPGAMKGGVITTFIKRSFGMYEILTACKVVIRSHFYASVIQMNGPGSPGVVIRIINFTRYELNFLADYSTVPRPPPPYRAFKILYSFDKMETRWRQGGYERSCCVTRDTRLNSFYCSIIWFILLLFFYIRHIIRIHIHFRYFTILFTGLLYELL